MRVCVLFWLSLLISFASTRDYYEVLELKRDATDAELKKAYRKLSKLYHPDKNPDPAAQTIFVEVAEAYEVLIDPNKRATYDRYGEEGVKKQQQQGGQTNPFDLFSQFGFGGFNRRQSEGEERGTDTTMDLRVTLEDLYKGREYEVAVRNQVLCPKCRGSGAEKEEDVQTCPVCGGSGIKITTQRLGPGFVQQMQSTCDKCGGKGKTVKSTCPKCKGQKVVSGEKILDVVVEQGMADGQTITFENAGDEHPDHLPGHINFRIVTLPHPYFERTGNDLHYTHHISLLDALVGFQGGVKHLDGHQVPIQTAGVTKPGEIRRIAGEGMPLHNYASQKGDLYVKFIVDFPPTLTQAQKDGFGRLL